MVKRPQSLEFFGRVSLTRPFALLDKLGTSPDNVDLLPPLFFEHTSIPFL